MKFVVAMDSFKGACTAKEACLAVEEGILEVVPGAIVVSVPLADGGEGTTQALVEATEGRFYETLVEDPLGPEFPKPITMKSALKMIMSIFSALFCCYFHRYEL